jgi:hypothetical protein
MKLALVALAGLVLLLGALLFGAIMDLRHKNAALGECQMREAQADLAKVRELLNAGDAGVAP